MSKLKEQIEVDIVRFLDNIQNQNQNDRIETLRNLLDKYVHLSKSDHIMDHHDLTSIISSAKGIFSSDTFPVYLGDKKIKVNPADLSSLCLIESTINYLNKKDCLKKIAKFNKKKE